MPGFCMPGNKKQKKKKAASGMETNDEVVVAHHHRLAPHTLRTFTPAARDGKRQYPPVKTKMP
jgi:hypothetical protein